MRYVKCYFREYFQVDEFASYLYDAIEMYNLTNVVTDITNFTGKNSRTHYIWVIITGVSSTKQTLYYFGTLLICPQNERVKQI